MNEAWMKLMDEGLMDDAVWCLRYKVWDLHAYIFIDK